LTYQGPLVRRAEPQARRASALNLSDAGGVPGPRKGEAERARGGSQPERVGVGALAVGSGSAARCCSRTALA
jgi:hypothetical protein